MQGPGIVPLTGSQARREEIERDRGSPVDRCGQRGQLLCRLEAALQRGRSGAEVAHALPVASGGSDTRLLEAARGFVTLAGCAQIARLGKDRGQELSRAQQVDIRNGCAPLAARTADR